MIKHDLLILGSQNVKEADQELSRDQIYPVQILHKDKRITPVHFFNNWGDVGVRLRLRCRLMLRAGVGAGVRVGASPNHSSNARLSLTLTLDHNLNLK